MNSTGPTSPVALLRLDHIGIVVADMTAAIKQYQTCYGAKAGPVIDDPVQKVQVAFLDMTPSTRIELVKPAAEDSPVLRFSGSGGGLHHTCWEVADIVDSVDVMQAHGALVVCQPVPAVAFDGRLIAFVYTRDRQLLEFLEAR